MRAARPASAPLLQHRGHFALMNYFVVFGTTGRMVIISSMEGRERESDFFSLFYCKVKGGGGGWGALSASEGDVWEL